MPTINRWQQLITTLYGNRMGFNPDNELVVDGKVVATQSRDGNGNVTGLTDADGDPLDVLMSVQGDGIAAPSSSATPAAGAAGALTGTYGYAVTFVTSLGETAPWPGTVTTVAVTAQRINLTAIPVGPAGTTARRIYRTIGTAVDVKDYFYLTEIADNTTTTYTDNAADGTLGDPINWAATNRGIIREGGVTQVAVFSDQSTAFGQGAMTGNAGYACSAFGFEALNAVTSGRRNCAFGVYALESLTVGYENCAFGVHAGGGVTTAIGNTLIGYSAGGATSSAGNYNTAVGHQVFQGSGASKGIGNTAVGYRALTDINTADYCIAIGYAAGKYANASRQLFIDNADRSNITNCQNIGIIYGKMESTAIAQVLHLNALVRIGPPSVAVASLPAASSTYTGFRAFVTDANATTFASIVAGGGSNGVPVYCDGTNWRIG